MEKSGKSVLENEREEFGKSLKNLKQMWPYGLMLTFLVVSIYDNLKDVFTCKFVS